MPRPQAGRPRLRVGVCGSGHWARAVHLPALAGMPEIDLAGVWGRLPERSGALADEFAIRPFAALDDLLAEVDAVSFAVPPDVQATMALRAANAGRHLLLEKPVATTLADADFLLRVVEQRQLSAVTFLTRMFVGAANDLVSRARAGKHTRGEASWSSKALLPGTPFTDSAWRNAEYGTLWDLGPHVLSIFTPVLGPVLEIEARRVRKAKFICRLLHAGGAESTMMLDQMDEALTQSGSQERYTFTGGTGVVSGGPFTVDPVRCFEAAVRLLLEGIGGDMPPGPNVRYARDIVAVLEAACSSIESGGTTATVGT